MMCNSDGNEGKVEVMMHCITTLMPDLVCFQLPYTAYVNHHMDDCVCGSSTISA